MGNDTYNSPYICYLWLLSVTSRGSNNIYLGGERCASQVAYAVTRKGGVYSQLRDTLLSSIEQNF